MPTDVISFIQLIQLMIYDRLFTLVYLTALNICNSIN